MRIHATMNLVELAEHMGCDADEVDARAMRDELAAWWTGWDTGEVGADMWDLCLREAAKQAQNVREGAASDTDTTNQPCAPCAGSGVAP